MTDDKPHFRAVITVFNAILTCFLLAGCVQQIGPYPPGPNPNPIPTPTADFKVLVLYESSASHSPAQLSAMNSGKVIEWLNNNTVGWRKFDQHVDAQFAPDWGPLITQAKTAAGSTLPAVVIFGRGKPKAFPLPAGQDAMVKLLEKAKG